MARSRGKSGADQSANAAPESDGNRKAGNGHPNNIPDREATQSFVSRIDFLLGEIAEFSANRRGMVKDVYEEMANALGKPRAACKAIVRKHRRRLADEKDYDKLAPEEREHFDSLEAALGDDFINSPLGQAAVHAEAAAH